ncbi:MAG: CXXX repeat peptide modification system protein [Tannerellaceae bacterium]|jgi:CXXX repeat modification system protein|nr:CXXX repeat peptide modification system protein [Tannerellaceae bacterium]
MKMKKRIGQVSEQEKEEIRALSNRKNALIELSKMIEVNDANRPQYEKLVKDIVEATICFQQWWNDMETKRQWKKHPAETWEIDFQTNDVYLVTE